MLWPAGISLRGAVQSSTAHERGFSAPPLIYAWTHETSFETALKVLAQTAIAFPGGRIYLADGPSFITLSPNFGNMHTIMGLSLSSGVSILQD